MNMFIYKSWIFSCVFYEKKNQRKKSFCSVLNASSCRIHASIFEFADVHRDVVLKYIAWWKNIADQVLQYSIMKMING